VAAKRKKEVVVATATDVTVLTKATGEQSLRLVKLYVQACNGNKTICHVMALLDSGSSTMILRKEVARQLGTKLNFKEVTVTTLHGTNAEKMASVKLQVSPDCKQWHNVYQAKTSSKFCFGDTQLRWLDYIKQDPIFKGVDVGDYNYNDIDLLVGRNVELLFLPLHGKENVRVDKNGVLVVNTELGWTIAGPLKTAAMTARYSCHTTIVNASTAVTSIDEEVTIAVDLRRLNNIDALGIKPKKTEMSRKEERKQAALDRTMFWKDGRITVQMLWKGEFAYVPPSELAARKRLQLLHKKLSKATPAVRSKYTKTISDDAEKGYVKKLSKEEADQLRQRFHWFLPHFIVPPRQARPSSSCPRLCCQGRQHLPQQHAERWSQEHGIDAWRATGLLCTQVRHQRRHQGDVSAVPHLREGQGLLGVPLTRRPKRRVRRLHQHVSHLRCNVLTVYHDARRNRCCSTSRPATRSSRETKRVCRRLPRRRQSNR
jgi:hypothetical protein